jgi:hypothetical protein
MYLDKDDTSISSQLFTSDSQPHMPPLRPQPVTIHPRSEGATERRNAESDPHALVQMRLESGDAIGTQRAIHNCDAKLVVQEGFRDATHTVVALEETHCMVVVLPHHIIWIAEARLRSRDEKIRFLRSLPLYAQCTTACLQRMADVMVRKWYSSDTTIVAEGGVSESVFFTVNGQLRVVKNSGTPAQETINVLGSGSCFGDIGALTRLPRSHSILTVQTCQFLGMFR